MFTYRCLNCGKQHSAEGSFEQSFQAVCFRCAYTFLVTGEMIRPPAGAGALSRAGAFTTPAGQPAVPSDEGAPAVRVESPPHEKGEMVSPPAEDVLLVPPDSWPEIRDAELAEDGEEAPAGRGGDSPTPRKPRQPADDPTPAGGGRWKLWAVVAGVALPLLAAAGAGGYWFFGKTRAPERPVAQNGKQSKKVTSTPTHMKLRGKSGETASTPSGKGGEKGRAEKGTLGKGPADKGGKSGPPGKPKNKTPVRISAPRLAAELVADRAGTNSKYESALLEVTGLCDKTEAVRLPKQPVRLRFQFLTAGQPIACEGTLATPDPRRGLTAVRGEPFTVRGVYARDGLLRDGELVPLSPPADARYKGRTVEVVGVVSAVLLPDRNLVGFPGLHLEGDTGGRVEVECLFRKPDAGEVRRIEPGSLVTVRGTCAGRRRGLAKYHVRLDNSELVYTTAPEPPASRVEALTLVRAYGEDLRADLLPAPGAEERVEGTRTVDALGREFAADAKAFEKKYRHRLLTVSGRLARKVYPQELLLEAEGTDQRFKVSCRFPSHLLRRLADTSEFRVRGLVTGMKDAHTLRLDDCEALGPGALKDTRVLTADYLPHKPGTVLVYDEVEFPVTGKSPHTLLRRVWFQREGGVTESVTTHAAKLQGRSLFDESEKGWTTRPRTKKVRLPGPVYRHALSGGFVQVGRRVLVRGRVVETVWEPALKVGAGAGDSWEHTHGDVKHVYTLEKFGEHQGKPCAVVKEVVITNLDESHPHEVRHVYVRGVGEVERREWLRVSSREKRTLAERKLVSGEDLHTPPEKGPTEKKTEKKTETQGSR